MTITSENEPLMGRKNSTYSAISENGSKRSSVDNDFVLDSLGHVIMSRQTSVSNGAPTPNGKENLVVAVDRICYTWKEMNVFTAASTAQSRRRWTAPWKRSEPGTEQRKHILKNVSGAAYPGELLAIMGASGAGKTTLLNTLMFRSGSELVVSGQRAINGVPVSSGALTSLSAYVQQDDLFIGTLTVREHLIFHSLVRMDRGIPYKQRLARVEEVICELALTKCQNTIIGKPGRLKGISGGEKKRLSFASEVLTNPPLMFCDEPTSGLDSFMAQNVVAVMKSMAEKGKTVVSTIHQPSSEIFSMFDRVILMAEGRIAFIGTSAEACSFFKDMGAPCPSNYNPADFFIQILAVVPTREDACRATIDMVCDAFDRSPTGIKLATENQLLPEMQAKLAMNGGWTGWGEDYNWQIGSDNKKRSPYKANWIAQFRAVMWRSWLSVIKEPMLIKVRIIQTLCIALLIGVIYFQQNLDQDGVMNINGAIFIFLTNMTFQNVFAVVNVFCAELPVFMREHFNGTYRVDVYFLCKTMAELPLFIFIPVLFTCVTYFMIGLNPDLTRFFTAMLIITMVANVATSFGYLISCASSSVPMALNVGPPIIIPFLLFGGFFLNSASVPWYFEWLSYFSWFKYGNEALLINQWSGVEDIACTVKNSTCPRNGKVVLDTYNFHEENLVPDILSLCALVLGFRICAFLSLLAKTYRKE